MNQIIVIDSDDEADPKCEAEHNQLSQITQKHESANTIVESCAVANIWQPAIQYQKVSLTNIAESNLPSDLVVILIFDRIKISHYSLAIHLSSSFIDYIYLISYNRHLLESKSSLRRHE